MKIKFGSQLSLIKKSLEFDYYLIIPFLLSVFLFCAGYYVATPLTTSYDPAMHAEIVDPIIATQIYPTSWSPLADTGYTYPPLFHWIAFVLSRTGIEPIKVVVFLGIVLYALFPLLVYFIGSLWGRKTGLLSALAGAGLMSWSAVFLAGEYPQLLAMDLSVVFLYFYLRRDFIKSGVFLGLVALSHPFVPVYLSIFIVVVSLFNLSRNFGKRNEIARNFVKCCGIALIIALIWLPQYFAITYSATTHQWRNVRWYYAPGFVGLGEIGAFFFSFGPDGKISPIVFIFSLAGAGYILANRRRKNEDTAILTLFVFTVLFSVFHIPGTQYKFPDMLSLAIPPLSAVGAIILPGRLKVRKFFRKAAVSLLVFAAFFAMYGILISAAHPYRQTAVPAQNSYDAALWLRNYDPEYSRIVKTGDDEVWFSVISHKYAMDPMVTDLEVLTENTKRQMDDRGTIIERMNNSEPVSDLAGKYGIKYVITEGIGTGINEGKLVYEKKGVKIYEFPGSLA